MKQHNSNRISRRAMILVTTVMLLLNGRDVDIDIMIQHITGWPTATADNLPEHPSVRMGAPQAHQHTVNSRGE